MNVAASGQRPTADDPAGTATAARRENAAAVVAAID
jgi:hypothetical protein